MSEITPNTPNPVREDAYVEELAEKLGIDPQYIPKSPVWRNEEEIKAIAEMFANMSGGSGVLVVHVTWSDNTGTCDKTAAEIWAALQTGCVNLAEEGEGWGAVYSVVYAEYEDGEYSFYVATSNGNTQKYTAESGTDYPTTTTN